MATVKRLAERMARYWQVFEKKSMLCCGDSVMYGEAQDFCRAASAKMSIAFVNSYSTIYSRYVIDM